MKVCCLYPKENHTRCGSATLEAHPLPLDRLAYRLHQSHPCIRNRHLVCVHHHIVRFYIRIRHPAYVRHLYIRIRHRLLLVQQSTKMNLEQTLERFGRRLECLGQRPGQLLPLDCMMHIELELSLIHI